MSVPIDLRDVGLREVGSYAVNENYRNDLQGILISEGEVKSRIERLSQEIAQNYSPGFIAYCVLDGAMKFYDNLLSYDKMPPPFVRSGTAKSYGHGTKSGELETNGFNFSEAENQEILLVEDIIDTAQTLHFLISEFRKCNPKKIGVASLLSKPSRRKYDINVDYGGFIIPDVFVVGYGMDYDDRYRFLKHIGVLKEEIYKK